MAFFFSIFAVSLRVVEIEIEVDTSGAYGVIENITHFRGISWDTHLI